MEREQEEAEQGHGFGGGGGVWAGPWGGAPPGKKKTQRLCFLLLCVKLLRTLRASCTATESFSCEPFLKAGEACDVIFTTGVALHPFSTAMGWACSYCLTHSLDVIGVPACNRNMYCEPLFLWTAIIPLKFLLSQTLCIGEFYLETVSKVEIQMQHPFLPVATKRFNKS